MAVTTGAKNLLLVRSLDCSRIFIITFKDKLNVTNNEEILVTNENKRGSFDYFVVVVNRNQFVVEEME